MNVFVMASGSKGNMTYLRMGEHRMFVDAGISFRKIKLKMETYKEDLMSVRTLFITHEHRDHTMGLPMLLKYGAIERIYLTEGTYRSFAADLKELMADRIVIVRADEPFSYGTISCTPFMVSHDAAEPVGYVFVYDGKKLVHLTDTGYVDESYREMLSDADIYIFEANHHPESLMQSMRPFSLKKRILGERGHLSNDDAAYLINLWIARKPAVWVVSHISEDCNTVLDIEEAIVRAFDDPTKVTVYYATQDGLPVIVL
ncbi:MAG: MBL fold metallo-hydrolase [Acholeplasmataceae bacterium]